jgi:peptide/nickel transport system substrate-binding protein
MVGLEGTMSDTMSIGGLSRRELLKSAAAGSALLAAPRAIGAPALAQSARRDLRIGVFGGEFGKFSPVQRMDAQSTIIVHNVFDGLVRIDYENRKILPWLAEDWSQPDPLTWRIKLREGIKWHHGYGEMTARDILYTWQYHLDSKSYIVSGSLLVVDTMKTDGTYVLEVKTKEPFGAFPGITMGRAGFILSEKAHKEIGPQNYGDKPVGQGPYMVESVRANDVVLVRNPDYWRPGFPKLDRLLYRAISDSSVRLQSMLRGELDFITHLDPNDAAEARSNKNFTFQSTPGWNWDYQQFNLRTRPDLPFHNKLVRQAISYAVDREAIVNEIYSGQATVTDNQIPAGFLGHRRQLLRYPKNGDLKKAKELVAQAGIRGYEVEVIVSDKDLLRKQLELLAAMVSEIGITYKIRNMDIGGYTNFRLNRRYEQLLQTTNITAPDPDATSWWFLHSDGASSSLNSPAMDKLLDDARREADLSKREALYFDIVDMTLEESPLIYHCNVNYVQVYNKGLTGYVPNNQEYAQFQDNTAWT